VEGSTEGVSGKLERQRIARLRRLGLGIRVIARELGRSLSTSLVNCVDNRAIKALVYPVVGSG
jgi:hypothetical protein